MFRKTVLTSAIIGAGLVTSAGAAFAGDDPGATDHHSGHSGHHHSTEVDKSCVSGAGSGSKHAEGALAVGSVLDAPISSNVCNILNNNLNGNLSNNKISVGGSALGVPELGGLLGDAGTAPSASQVQSAAPQAAPAAPSASSVPAGTSTVPIQG